MNTKILGTKGEELAKNYLKKHKFKVLYANYATKLGEIDLICEKCDVIVFVEVKTRSSEKFGLPREAVTQYKQNKIKLVAKQFLQENKLFDRNCRFDVIEILDDKVTHIEGAFV